LLRESIAALDIKSGGTYADMTAGGGGHSAEIAARLGGGTLYCFDRDRYALERAGKRLKDYANVIYVHDNFRNIKVHGVPPLDGALMDIGVSSFQLDDGERGFSYGFNAPLDMRMDCTGTARAAKTAAASESESKSAYEVVNYYRCEDLIKILREYGEEKYAVRIANAICAARTEKPVGTTFELAAIVKDAYPRKAVAQGLKSRGNHPGKRTFQAVRIEVNDELGSLRAGIAEVFGSLKTGGILAVITFHSLEDRIVKTMFREFAAECVCPDGIPFCVCGKVKTGELIFRKPVTPSVEEVSSNNRCRSAKLRVIRKIS